MVKPGSTRGRQRVEMKKIQNKTRLGVTFTKRRAGLFKKASELATLCGVQIAILVFSPGKKVYSLGQPNVDTILGRFIAYVKEMHGVQFVHDRLSNHPVDDLKQTRVDTLNTQLKEVERLVETEKNIAKELKEELQNMQDNTIAYKPKDQLNFSEKLELHGMMQELKGRISSEIQQRVMKSSFGIQEGILRREGGEIFGPKHNLSLNLGL